MTTVRTIQCRVDDAWAGFGWHASVASLQFRSDGRELAAVLDVGGAYRIAFWDLRANVGREPIDLGGGFEGGVAPVLSPDFGLIAHVGNESRGDGRGLHAVLSRRSRGKLIDRFLGWWWAECITAVAFSPDGRRLAVTGWDAHDGFPGEGVAVWDVAAVRRARGASEGGRRWVARSSAALLAADDFLTNLAFSPDGSTLAAGTANRGVIRWDVATARPQPPLRWRESMDRVWCDALAYSPDGRHLAVVNRKDGRFVLLDAATGAARLVPPEDPGALGRAVYFAYGFAYHPTGRLLATVALDEAVTLWDVASGTKRQELTGDAGALRSIAFSPDGRTCAAGGDNGRVVVWEVSG